MKKNWYIFDCSGNILNEGDGTPDRAEAEEKFRAYFENVEDAEGFTLCEVTEEDGCWTECLQEITASEVFE